MRRLLQAVTGFSLLGSFQNVPQEFFLASHKTYKTLTSIIFVFELYLDSS